MEGMPVTAINMPAGGSQVFSAANRGGSYLLRLIVLPYLYTSLLFYAIVQVQDSVLGRVYLMHQHIRLLGLGGALIASAVYVLQRNSVRIRRPALIALSLTYCVFVVVDFGLKLARGTIRPSAAIYGETYLYFFVFLIPLMLIMSDNDSSVGGTVIVERGVFRMLYVIAIPVFALGYAQVVLNSPILGLGDEAAGYVVEVPTRSDIGQVRAFSVFGAAFSYGHFITLVGTLAASRLLLRRRDPNRGVFAVILIAAAVASASTLTRTTYVEFLVSLGAVLIIPLLLRSGWSNRFLLSTSVGFAVLAYAAIVGFFLLTRLQSGGLYIAGASSTTAVVFGQGYIQGDKFAELQGIHPLLFDSTYVDVLLFSGIVGLLLFILFFVALFHYTLDRFRQTGAYWWLALSGMYFSYPLVAAINIYASALYLITCMVFGHDVLARRRLISATPNVLPSTVREPPVTV